MTTMLEAPQLRQAAAFGSLGRARTLTLQGQDLAPGLMET